MSGKRKQPPLTKSAASINFAVYVNDFGSKSLKETIDTCQSAISKLLAHVRKTKTDVLLNEYEKDCLDSLDSALDEYASALNVDE